MRKNKVIKDVIKTCKFAGIPAKALKFDRKLGSPDTKIVKDKIFYVQNKLSPKGGKKHVQKEKINQKG